MNAAPTLTVAPVVQTAAAEGTELRLQRKCSCEEEGSGCARCSGGRPKLQRKSLGAATAGVPEHARSVIASQGQPLDSNTRSVMEPRLGFDFSAVRIHSDDRARDSARRLNAAAYTVGTHVVLGNEQPATKHLRGYTLLAHELAHVVQQSRPGVDFDEGRLEREADDAAEAVQRGGSFVVRGRAGPSVQRAEAGSGPVKRDVLDTIMEMAKSRLGLTSTSGKLLIAGVEGVIEGFQHQWTKEGGTGEHLRKEAKKFSLTDVPALMVGYLTGVVKGLFSPLTDLFSIAVLLEQLRNFGFSLAQSALTQRDELKAMFDSLLAGLSQLALPMLDVVRDMKNHKLETLRMLLGFAQSQGGMMEKMEGMAKSAGYAGGEELAKSFETPWEEKKEARKQLSWKTQFFQKTDQILEDWGQATLIGPWGKVGDKAGYFVGFAVVQVALLAFSGGVGNMISAIGGWLGGLAKAGSLLGKTLAGVAKFVQAAGKVIEMLEGAVHALMALLSKPILPVLEPVLKPFGALMERLGKFVRKLFGMAEKESAHLVTTAAAKLEGAAQHTVPTPHAPAPHAPASLKPPAAHASAKSPDAPKPHHADAPPRKEVAPSKEAALHKETAPNKQTAPEQKAPTEKQAAPKKEPAPAAKQAEPENAKVGEHDADAGKPATKPAERGAVVAEEPTADGHQVKVRESGDIELCSPKPCPLLENVYGDIIGGSVPMSREMDTIRKLRKTNPKEAAKRSAALKKELDEIRKKSAPSQGQLDKEFQDFNDMIAAEGGGPVTSRKPGKTAGSTAPKEHPTAQDIAMNIDEIEPVGGAKLMPNLTEAQALAEGRRRALSIDNRGMKEAIFNQRTKHVGVDKRELAQLGKPREPVSLRAGSGKGDEHLALFDRRFSEIEETQAIGDEILKTIEGKTTRSPGALKEEFNSKFWDVIRNPGNHEGKLAKNGKVVAEAMERGGFGLVQAPNGKFYFRQLTESELKSRGFTFIKGQGWIRAGGMP
jgi:hypothetical protein